MNAMMRPTPALAQAKRSREVTMTRSQQMAHDLLVERFQRQVQEFIKMCVAEKGEDAALNWRLDPRAYLFYLTENPEGQ